MGDMNQSARRTIKLTKSSLLIILRILTGHSTHYHLEKQRISANTNYRFCDIHSLGQCLACVQSRLTYISPKLLEVRNISTLLSVT